MDDSCFCDSTSDKRNCDTANNSIDNMVEHHGSSADYIMMGITDRIHSKHLRFFALRNLNEDQTIHTDD